MARSFGSILREIRLSRSMSQEEFAALLGTTKQVISRYENNLRTPKITAAQEYASVLGVSLNYLLGEEPPPFSLPNTEKRPAAQGDGAWELIQADPVKRAVAIQIANMSEDDLKRLIALLEAARLLPDE